MPKKANKKPLPEPVKEIGSVVGRTAFAFAAIIGAAVVVFIIMAGLTIFALSSTECRLDDSKRQQLAKERTTVLDGLTILSGQKITSSSQSSSCAETAVVELNTPLNTGQAMDNIRMNLQAQGFKPDEKDTTFIYSEADNLLRYEEWFVRKDESIGLTYNFSEIRSCTELGLDCLSNILDGEALQLPLKSIEVIYNEE